jgi:hypothetical protein
MVDDVTGEVKQLALAPTTIKQVIPGRGDLTTAQVLNMIHSTNAKTYITVDGSGVPDANVLDAFLGGIHYDY